MVSYVFDASALVAYFLDTPGAPKVKDLLKEALRGHAEILMSAVNFGEAYGFVLRQGGMDQAYTALGAVQTLRIRFVEATVQRCCRAAEIKVRFRLHFADSFAAALAIENKATLVTSDADFRRLGHSFPIVWLKP